MILFSLLFSILFILFIPFPLIFAAFSVDFGISARLKSYDERRNTFIGSAFWMAPEIIACEKDTSASYSVRSDIWSLGITCIELAEKEPPLADYHPLRAMVLVTQNPAPSLTHPKKWSKYFRDFVGACLVKDDGLRSTSKQLLDHPFLLEHLNSSRFSLRRKGQTLVEMLENLGWVDRQEVMLTYAKNNRERCFYGGLW